MTLAHRDWVPAPSETLVQTIATRTASQDSETIAARITTPPRKIARSTNATVST